MPANDDWFVLNVELFNQLAALRGWVSDKDCAAGIGVNLTTVWRARNGAKVGEVFMAKTTATLGVGVGELFRLKTKTPVGAP